MVNMKEVALARIRRMLVGGMALALCGFVTAACGLGHSESWKIGYSAGDDPQQYQSSVVEGGESPDALCSQLNQLAQESASGSSSPFDADYPNVPQNYDQSDFTSGCLAGVKGASGN
jgi:hypothetical protein